MNYQDYMIENFNSEIDDSYFTEAVTAKVTYYLRDNLLSTLEKTMTKKMVERVIEFTGNFISDHYKQLFTSGPVYNFQFAEKETKILYELANVNKDKLLEMFSVVKKETYDGRIDFHNILILPHILIITALLIWAIKHKNEDIIECCEYLTSFAFYPIIFSQYWPYGVREDVMDYTIEHLTTKNIIRKVRNLHEYLKYQGMVCVKNYRTRLGTVDVQDAMYVNFIQRVRTQINNGFKNIKSAYTINYNNNASQHTSDGKMDDGNLRDKDSLSSQIGSIAESTYSKFTTNGTNETAVKMMADGGKVSAGNLLSYINKILTTKGNKLPKLIENIIIAFFDSKPVDDNVGSGVFFSFALSLYRSIGTSKEPTKQEINQILRSWTHDILELDKVYTTRPTTIISYRRAIYNYMIYMIQQYN